MSTQLHLPAPPGDAEEINTVVAMLHEHGQASARRSNCRGIRRGNWGCCWAWTAPRK